jgi:hypothetical protein
MQRKQVLKSGVTLVFALVTRSQESFDMANERYNILCKGRRIYTALTEEEYFNTMEDLSIEYYQTGSPLPEDLETEILLENNQWLQKQNLVV